MELPGQLAAVLSFCDPMIPTLTKMRHFDVPELTSKRATPEYFASLDRAEIVTDHSAFDGEMIVRHTPLVDDTRNAIHAVAPDAKHVWKA